MTPQEELDFLKLAFQDLFNNEKLDLSRFLRLVADVLDPITGYGPAKCVCGAFVEFEIAQDNGRPFGCKCPLCKTIYEWTLYKSPKRASRRIVITDKGGSTIGHVESQSDSGVFICDNGVVQIKEKV